MRWPDARAAGGLAAILVLLAGLVGVAPTRADDERVQFTATDGVQLIGHLYGTHGPGVILGHMYPADQRSWAPFAQTLAGAGFRVLTFDCRGYGESEGAKQVAEIDRDMEGAYRYLVGRKMRPVFLVGASMSGTAALLTASRVPVAGVVTLSAPLAFRGLDATAVLGAVRAPKLLIAARDDGDAAATAARIAEAAPGPERVLIVDGSAHGTLLFDGPTATTVADAIKAFLAAPDA